MIDIRKIKLGESIVIDETIAVRIPPGFGVFDGATIAVVGRLTNTGTVFALEGQGQCRILADCALCLEPVPLELSFHIGENFVEAEAACGDDISFSDGVIDIFPAIERNFFVNIPMKVICSYDCAGLWHKLDSEEEVNPQFQQLLQFFDT